MYSLFSPDISSLTIFKIHFTVSPFFLLHDEISGNVNCCQLGGINVKGTDIIVYKNILKFIFLITRNLRAEGCIYYLSMYSLSVIFNLWSNFSFVDGNNLKKCRARFGLDQQSSWCKPCR